MERQTFGSSRSSSASYPAKRKSELLSIIKCIVQLRCNLDTNDNYSTIAFNGGVTLMIMNLLMR